MGTWVYLQQLNSWFAPGPLIVGLVYMAVGIGIWTAAWQIAHNNLSTRFFAQHNAWWTGIAMTGAGVVTFLALAGPALLEALSPLWNVKTGIAVLATAGTLILVALGIWLFRWARQQP